VDRKPSKQEAIKQESDYLKGNILEELADDSLIQVSNESYELLKFHGTYQGYNRDTATSRKQQRLDKEYEFMLRMKLPAGKLTAWQYLELDKLADTYSNGTMRITTRQTFQFHHVLKGDLKPYIAEINKRLLSTLGGCGDVVRNVTTCSAPYKDNIHNTLQEAAYTLAKHFAPRTESYFDIWLDWEKLDYPFNPEASSKENIEPTYGDTYLPRKFKIGIARPEDNCVDVLTNDLALLALFEEQELIGYNVALGGGLGMTHNKPATYPRLATPIAFVAPKDLVKISEAVVKLQRDHGDRSNRKHARLKYMVEEKGIEWIKQTLEGYFGDALVEPKPMPEFAIHDHMGWHEQGDGKWFLGVPVSSGRIEDREGEAIRTGLREVIATYEMDLVLTPDQNIILSNIEAQDKADITRVLRSHGIKLHEDLTPLFRNTIACVAMPTCGKALTEAERVKLPMVAALEQLLDKYELKEERLTLRLAGCPNGCSRPYVGDISVVGRTPGFYALYIGGDFQGTRLGEKVFDKVPYNELMVSLEPMISLFKEGREPKEGFGDFCYRYGIDKVKKIAVDALSEHHGWAA
jgi:sulfite reductase (ferredoxin)